MSPNNLFIPLEIPEQHRFNSETTFSEYATVWLDDNCDMLSVRTIERYNDLFVRINNGIGHIPVCKLELYHLRQFLKKLSLVGENMRTGKCLSDKTILHHYRLISVILQQAVRDELITVNPASKNRMKAPKVVKHEVSVLQAEDFRQLFCFLSSDTETNYRAKVAISIMALTGLRRGEVAGLQFGDFEGDFLTVRRAVLYTAKRGIYEKTPKTETSYRRLLISPWVQNIICEYQNWYMRTYRVSHERVASRKLFCQDDGKPIHPDTLTIWCRRFSEKHPSLKRFSPHMLRHTYASMLVGLGVSIKEVSVRLGHSKLTTTCNTYTHSMQGADKKAADILDQFRF